ncbi:ABC transporter substrate-binding protein [Rhodococcus sp. HNM0563]|uniref:ABC transporter substrate-binding protein n=1 Tax=Rhodococcus sp. HNM0563 TaxID=2716339 RepID=UPI00146BE852|nr:MULTISPECIES: ABC transporter substrate-binding protein [unclassified Rhodococcus (in: high G+C Gram-positive bacteria)]MCK0090304.1 ABC transporter substrate-binding protein [Rhodococcus sp. F64268]NLU61512.1 ABC transporter substrate-binding protein [Rhodococcus sp. HNM0563]
MVVTLTSRRFLTAGIAALALVIAGCGSGDDAASDSAPPAESGTPQAIVSLSPTTTEMLYAVGAGDQVVAVDDQSDHPEGVPVTDLSGYNPNVEAILGYDPDLVVATDDNGDLVAGLENAGVEVLMLPAAVTIDDTYAQLEQVGAATGHVGDAAELVAQMQTEIDEIVASVPEREAPLRYYHELDNTYYSVTDDTYIGQIYSMLGLTSIATGGDGYPQLSSEFIVEQNPDLIFLADSQCCGVTPETVGERAGWAELTAVRDGQVHVLDEDIASRWGPRIVDLVRELAAIVVAVPAGQPAP